MRLILGSSSTNRIEILKEAGYVFDIVVPTLEEKLVKNTDPYQRPLILAHAKADELAVLVEEPALIITADTIVMWGDELCEKPETKEEARHFLMKTRSNSVPETVTAIVITDTISGRRYEGVDITKSFFKPLPDEVIEDFIENGDPYSRAGAIAIQHPILKPYFERIEGRYESVLGMPIHLVTQLLEEAGYKP